MIARFSPPELNFCTSEIKLFTIYITRESAKIPFHCLLCISSSLYHKEPLSYNNVDLYLYICAKIVRIKTVKACKV
jgi:hypothetical protein